VENNKTAAMKKTININIAGQLFRLDEDAYEILTRYLEHVSARFRTEAGGEETISDIESRIAEIFGGGNEPPTLVSKEMVKDMINIMGAPEDYYDEASIINGGSSYTRKAMYDPNSSSARLGKALSDFFKGLGKILSGIWRILCIIFGSVFTVFSFTMLFLFVLLLFFHNAPFLKEVIEPEITNLNTLLSIVLNVRMVTPVIILTAIVILIPLAALAYLGIKMIFNIKERSRTLNIIVFVSWVAAACALAVILSLQLVVYADHERVEDRIMLSNPPDTLWIATGKKVSSLNYDDFASVDEFCFYKNSSSKQLFGTVELNIFGSDTTAGWISVERVACSNSDLEASEKARAVDFNWNFRRDTLYLDEFFSLPAGERWNGSLVEVDVSLPDKTIIKFVPGSNHANWMFWSRLPEVQLFRINGWDLEDITE
jgi:hypothetical protein